LKINNKQTKQNKNPLLSYGISIFNGFKEQYTVERKKESCVGMMLSFPIYKILKIIAQHNNTNTNIKKRNKKKTQSIFCGVMLSRDRAIIRS
jgi:hypothetical protein